MCIVLPRDHWLRVKMQRKDIEEQVSFLHGGQGQRAFSGPRDSPQRAEWIGDDDCFSHTSTSTADAYEFINVADTLQRTKLAHTIPEGEKRKGQINTLPDELLCEIFRFLPRGRDRATCASVCMRWLLLQSHMQNDKFMSSPNYEGAEESCDEAYSAVSYLQAGAIGLDDFRRVERQPQWAIGDLSRNLEGKKATDVRLAAIAVGTRARGGLGKLSIKQGSSRLNRGVTDFGMSAIGICCSALRAISLWDCPNVGDEGLHSIAKGCRLLEKINLYKCPLVGDLGLQSVAVHCPMVSFVSLDECKMVGDRSLCAIGEGCVNLSSLNIRNCPLIGDDGLMAVSRNSKKLRRMKLDGLRIGDRGLVCIGMYCKGLTCLTIHSLNMVTEEGFLLFGKASGILSLRRFCVRNCKGFGNDMLTAVGNNQGTLKFLTLVECENITDEGLLAFLQSCASLEVLELEMCHKISANGMIAAFSGTSHKLREVQVRKCSGIKDVDVLSSSHYSINPHIKSISLVQCLGVGDVFLALLGQHCHQITSLDFTGLKGITDEGLLAILYGKRLRLTSVNVSGCSKLTDRVVHAIAEACGDTLRNLVLDGCKRVTDKALKTVASLCVALEDLDVSQCSISNEGVMALVAEAGETLSSLNLSGCEEITDKVLAFIEKNCQCLADLNLKHCKGLTKRGLDTFESRLWKCDVICT